MPPVPLLWRHVIINTKGTWLHGDARGFRTRRHRIHSSGDYRNPPPASEHARLLAYHVERCPDEVIIDRALRPVIGRALVEFFLGERRRVLVCAVGKVHAHGVVELPDDIGEVRRIVGEAKRFASRRVTDSMPGALWSSGGTFVRIENAAHLKEAYDYDLYRQGPGAWTWSFRDRSMLGTFARKRSAGGGSGAALRLPRRGQ